MNSFINRVNLYLHENPLFRRFLKNSGYLFSSSSIGIALTAVQAILAARLLGKEELGLITLIMTITTTVNQLFSFRMGEYVIRFFSKAKAENDLDQIFAVIKISTVIECLTSIIAFVFLFFMAPFFVKIWIKNFDPVQATLLIRLFGLVILANMVTETANGVLRITDRFKTQAILQLIQTVATFSLIVFAFFFQWGFVEILLAYFIGKLIIGSGPAVMAVSAMNHDFGANWWRSKSISKPSFKETIKFAVSTNLSATTKLVASESEPLWLGFFLNEGAVGIFKVAMSVVNLITIPITPLIQTAFPDITQTVVAKKWQQLKRLLLQITVLAAAWTLPASLFMVLTGKWLVWLYGTDFPASYPTFMILLIGFGITNIFFWNRSLLLSFGKANIPLYVLAGGAILKMSLAFVVIPMYGINGEAALLSGYFVLTTLILVIIGYRKILNSESKVGKLEAA